MPESDPLGKIIVTIDSELEDLIPGFLKSREKDIETVRECLGANDFETIRRLGHSLKGNGAGYGFDDLSVIGRQLEQAAAEQSPDDVTGVLEAMASYLERVEVVFD